MLNSTPPSPRRVAREARAISGMRPTPEVRDLVDADFFRWVELYAGSLEQLGIEYRDDIALRAWYELGFSGHAPSREGMRSIVVGRGTNLAGFAVSAPSFSLLDGERYLEVKALFVERMEYDGAALEALMSSLHARANEVGAASLRWYAPADADAFLHLSHQLGDDVALRVIKMPVMR